MLPGRFAARRDERKWGATYRSFPDWSTRTDFLSSEEERRYIRRWIAERWRLKLR